ncbi:MAG: amidohydrolase family protein [Rhodospirillaceae bacterium]|jgi:allantoinase|nr:amidohydrolase family protein [Rhodospirillaceae bacterium]MBT7614303.1 amidohydrolase family protein [Rhodospirillaceae bacterium]MBT7648895.1 amidohydrolase family protein [Rhodospirillaceae bacterium]
MRFDLVVKGDLVLPDGVAENGWIGVSDGKIAAIGEGEAPDSAAFEDASGSHVYPGVVDGQTHAGSIKGFKGLEDLTRSAAAGGVTTIVDMPFDEPDPVWSRDLLDAKVEIANQVAYIDVALYGSVKKKVEVDEIAALADGGACAFKMSTYEANPHRFPRIPHHEMTRAFSAIAETGLTVAVHNEDQEIVDDAIAQFREARQMGANIHHASRPPLAELLANSVILEIGAHTGARAHIVHSSLARGFDMARQYREQGFEATCETCIHYLVFDEADVIEKGARGKVNPPIRPDQREAIWERLEAGDGSFVSSDHCSWPLERKPDDDIFKAAPGAPGVECLLPAMVTAAAARGHGPAMVADMLCEGPARHFGLWPQKGAIRVGGDADLAIVSPERYRHDDATLHCELAPWSPYDGMEFSGRVTGVWLRGQKAFDGKDVLTSPGQGRFVRPV